MAGFLFTFIAVILAGLGARDQLAVAGLTSRQGQRPAVLLTAVAISIATALAAAWAAATIAPQLIPKARMIMALLALVFAAGECLLLVPRTAAKTRPEEPTNSLFALAVIMAAHQITDAGRFLVFAIALASAAVVPAGIGGALGGAVVIAAAWAMPETFHDHRLRLARRIAGGGFALLAAVMAVRLFVG